MVTMAIEQQQTKANSPTFSTILNTQEKRQKEYLPTPVTPASDFVQFNNKNTNSAFSTFSVIKPPVTNTTIRNTNTVINSTTPSATSSSTNEAKPYQCTECQQTFSRPHNLKSHLTTHSSERPFQCDVCNHHFRRHHDLKRHQKLHTGERPYVCSDCFRSFARLDALNRHRRAEGGTACSMVHQQVKKESATSNNNKKNDTRPVIPQLHIPHPASHPDPKVNITQTPIPPTHSPPPPPPQQQQQQLLPSPNALPQLPITNYHLLKPIYQQRSLPTTPSSPPKTTQPTKYHPYQLWSPRYSNRPTLPPLSSSPPPKSSPPDSQIDRLLQENEDLKRDIDQIRAMSQREANTLKSRIHDLEVENKVLRSLIHQPQQTTDSETMSTSSSDHQ